VAPHDLKVVFGNPRATVLTNHRNTIQVSKAIRHLARIVRIVEPALTVEQELVGVFSWNKM
jgi:hypothetical protein